MGVGPANFQNPLKLTWTQVSGTGHKDYTQINRKEFDPQLGLPGKGKTKAKERQEAKGGLQGQ